MHINVLSTVVLLGGALLLGRCSTSPTEQSGPKAVVERDGKVFIIDVTRQVLGGNTCKRDVRYGAPFISVWVGTLCHQANS